MDIQLHEITVRDVFDGYYNDEESGRVVAFGGKLNVRPAYQREFVYDDKKKVAVMEKEREYFVYGNEELDIPGCVGNNISTEVGNKIYDSMIDFAKYAFNKSHAAAYAVVAYQTAYLKYYYPVEYMAALITSVIDNSGKTSEYILITRNMGIPILPPDINEGTVGFSVSGDSIRYALTAIKNVGRPVIESIVEERFAHGPFTNLKDFVVRTAERDVNKRFNNAEKCK